MLLSLSSPIPDLLTTLHKIYAYTNVGQQLVKQTEQNTSDNNLYKFSNGLLYYKDKFFIPDISQLCSSILHEYHHTQITGYLGVKATLAHLSSSFSWPGVHLEVKKMVKQCAICQQNRYQTQKKKGLL
ncbi:unnamed protein product [Vicia faba]|uniref:Integrase zinc-binding domain-containing protein n=1 Tax=Vicia faba TaxID=3906 RepID=A0AAV0Z8V0_VICFA|nr:unnamed protein product [Vicia faba]